MSRIIRLVTILITGFGLTLAGIGASPVSIASTSEAMRISTTFSFGSSVLGKAQKIAIKNALATTGTNATFVVTGVAGKIPGVSDGQAKSLAKKRGQAVITYLGKLGVSRASVTIEVKITRLGTVPKTKLVGTLASSVVATVPIASATSAPAVALTCAAGGTCVVGDRGPGGGIVYYVSAANFTSTGSTCNTTCKYLEVAPSTWQSEGVSVASDLTYVWSTNISTLTGQDATTLSTEGVPGRSRDERFNWKIGQGFNNTRIMKVDGATSAAQAAVLSYAGDSIVGQWFLPSMNELNELCKYAWGEATGDLTVGCRATGTFKDATSAGNDLGGFTVGLYWSSSEEVGANTYSQRFVGGSGSWYTYAKTYAHNIRPVRAF